MKGLQDLFNELVKEYNLRAITIDNETWYGINDLPMDRKAINKSISRLRQSLDGDLKSPTNFIDENTKLISVSMVTENHIRNFNAINNTGELFGNFKMINYLVLNSRLGVKYKINLIDILDKIRIQGYYIDNNINENQIRELKRNIRDLEYKLHKERTQRLYTTNEVVKKINVNSLLTPSLYRYLAEELHLGDYKVVKKNRRFTPNDDFKNRVIEVNGARVSGKNIIFTDEFINRFNNCNAALERLKEINLEELAIKEKAIEERQIF